MKTILCLYLCWLTCWSTVALSEQTFYVAPSGSNGNSGTVTSPFRTVHYALQQMSEGDTVTLRHGEYEERVSWSAMASVDPYRLVAYPGEIVVIRSEGGVVLDVSGADKFEVEGIQFDGGIMNIHNGASNIVFTDCVISGVNGEPQAVRVSQVENLVFDGSMFKNNQVSVVVNIGGENHGVVFQNGTFLDNFTSQPGTQTGVLIANQTQSTGIRLENNRFELSGDKQSRPVLTPGDNASAIMVLLSEPGDQNAPEIRIVGNTIKGYRFRGTNDDTWYNPAYLRSPAQGGEQGQGIEILHSSYLEISGNTFEWISRFGIVAYQSTHNTISGNSFQSMGTNGIFLVGQQGQDTHGAPLGLGGGGYNLIADNRVVNCGWLVGGGSGISSIFVGPGNLILRNFVSGQMNGTPGQTGDTWFGDGNGILADWDSNGTVVVGNVVVGNQGAGISLNRSSNSIVLQNTVIGNGDGGQINDNVGIFISGGTGPSDNIHIINNLIYNNRRSQIWVWETALDHTIRNNLLAPGPLTLTEYHTKLVDWFGQFYSHSAWTSNPPRPGNGIGSVGQRPEFRGDIFGGDPLSDANYYLPVNGSAGVAVAMPKADLAYLNLPMETSEFTPLDVSRSHQGKSLRPAAGANLGALEFDGTTDLLNSSRLGQILFQGSGNQANVWSSSLGTLLRYLSGKLFSTEYGVLSLGEAEGWVLSSLFGWTHFGENQATYGGWVNTERFDWMKFEQAGQNFYLWVPMMNSWMSVNPDGTFYSFQWRTLIPEGLNRYQSSVFGGLTTGEFNGWVASDRFGWMWANGDGTWFWSESRKEWLGVTVDGGIWSTAEGRFL